MNVPARMIEGWRARLLAACDKDERSDTAISLAAELGPNFVQQLRTTAREPSAKNVIQLCETLGVSLAHIFLGDDITPQDEEFFQLLRHSTEEGRKIALAILKASRSEE